MLNPNLKPPAMQELEDFLGKYIKGQPQAIKVLAQAYASFKSGVGKFSERDSRKPIGVFLFCGPSCTGKTQISRVLAQKFHGTPHAVTFIDCVSFQEKHEISKLIGSPPGYIGHGDKPLLSKDKLYSQIPGYQAKPSALESKSNKKEKTEKEDADEPSPGDVFSFWLCQLDLINQGLRNLQREYFQLTKSGLNSLKSDEIKKLIMTQREILKAQRNYILSSYTKLAQEFLQNHLPSARLPAPEGPLPLSFTPKNIEPPAAATDKEKPVLVIIFDEIEKAHESLWKFLLQLMREGRAVLGNGEETDLSRSFIILTSNIASKQIGNAARGTVKIGFRSGTDQTNLGKFVKAELKKTFSREFLNRLDATVIFNLLSPSDFRDILELEIEAFSLHLKKYLLELTVQPPVKDFILEETAKNPEEQVKSLQDCFKKHLANPIGNLLATGQLTGQKKLIVTLDAQKKVIFKN